jgi:hypothetical protein
MVVSVWRVVTTELLYHQAEKVIGTVAKVNFAPNPAAQDSYWFIVEFRDSKGIVHRANGWSVEPASLRRGYSIEVLYDPKDPSNIRPPKDLLE